MSLETKAQQLDLEPNRLDTEPGLLIAAGGKGQAEPVSASERFFAVDVLRGFALLGILAMNIILFGLPAPSYENPFRGGGFEGLDRAIWFFNHVVFDFKMMTIFSMLFGAGLVLMDTRAGARGARIGAIYFRRILWLFVIGLVHAYLIWDGDILVLYAQTGLFLYFFRNLRPLTLIALGISTLLLIVPMALGFGAAIDYVRATSARVEAQRQAGEKPSELDQRLGDLWTGDLRDELMPSPAKKAEEWDRELAAYRGSYLGIVRHKAFGVLMSQIFFFLAGGGLFTASRMLVGMGLMKLGVFSAQRSRRLYGWMVALGYGLGVPLVIFDGVQAIRHEFSYGYFVPAGIIYIVFGSLIVALGHVGVIMLIVKAGVLDWLTTRLAAVGRMALSNYLFDSIVCTTLFYGYGFGLFGHVNRTGLAGIVILIWVFQLMVSPIWLRHFRYGPAEWLWRSLTYWRLQPMRREYSISASAQTN